jgi:hypothetical protein
MKKIIIGIVVLATGVLGATLGVPPKRTLYVGKTLSVVAEAKADNGIIVTLFEEAESCPYPTKLVLSQSSDDTYGIGCWVTVGKDVIGIQALGRSGFDRVSISDFAINAYYKLPWNKGVF